VRGPRDVEHVAHGSRRGGRAPQGVAVSEHCGPPRRTRSAPPERDVEHISHRPSGSSGCTASLDAAKLVCQVHFCSHGMARGRSCPVADPLGPRTTGSVNPAPGRSGRYRMSGCRTPRRPGGSGGGSPLSGALRRRDDCSAPYGRDRNTGERQTTPCIARASGRPRPGLGRPTGPHPSVQGPARRPPGCADKGPVGVRLSAAGSTGRPGVCPTGRWDLRIATCGQRGC
jgi:hypothetical protein